MPYHLGSSSGLKSQAREYPRSDEHLKSNAIRKRIHVFFTPKVPFFVKFWGGPTKGRATRCRTPRLLNGPSLDHESSREVQILKPPIQTTNEELPEIWHSFSRVNDDKLREYNFGACHPLTYEVVSHLLPPWCNMASKHLGCD